MKAVLVINPVYRLFGFFFFNKLSFFILAFNHGFQKIKKQVSKNVREKEIKQAAVSFEA